ncbi:hypothetical protein MMC15_008685 [Xylographa vitiligo]|nr:hypothetical protein [Xylographa vitiligo]
MSDGPPNLGKAGQKEFQADKDRWWSQFTNVFEFAHKRKPSFDYRLSTDGESVSVLFVKSGAAANQQAEALNAAEERATLQSIPTATPPSDSQWVRGPSVPAVDPSRRVLGLDPGTKAVFTAVVHHPAAQQTLQTANPVR